MNLFSSPCDLSSLSHRTRAFGRRGQIDGDERECCWLSVGIVTQSSTSKSHIFPRLTGDTFSKGELLLGYASQTSGSLGFSVSGTASRAHRRSHTCKTSIMGVTTQEAGPGTGKREDTCRKISRRLSQKTELRHETLR